MKNIELESMREIELDKALKNARRAYRRLHLTGESPLIASVFHFVMFWIPGIALASLVSLYPNIYSNSVISSIGEYSSEFISKVIAFFVVGVIVYTSSKIRKSNTVASKKVEAALEDYNLNLIVIHSCYNSIIRDGRSEILEHFEDDMKYISGTSETVSNIVEKVVPGRQVSIVDISFNHSSYGSLITLEYYVND